MIFESLEPRNLCSAWTPIHAPASPGVEAYSVARSGHRLTITVRSFDVHNFSIADQAGPIGATHKIAPHQFRLTIVEPKVGGVWIRWSGDQKYEVVFAPQKDHRAPRAPN